MKIFSWKIRKFYVKAAACRTAIISALFLCLILPDSWAQHRGADSYTRFLTDAENIFLLRPALIQDVFFGITDFKGNKASAKRRVEHDVLGCQVNSTIAQGCRIEKLRLERQRLNMPRYYKIPVNFTRITASRYNKGKKRVVVHWLPELYTPPSMSIDQFLIYIGAAENSPYYQLKKRIGQIQLNPLFEHEIHFIADNALADSLLATYKQIPTDKEDSITFDFDYVITRKRYQIMDYFIQFKALSVRINHQTFKAVDRKD